MGTGGLALIDLLNRDGLLAATPISNAVGCLGSEGVWADDRHANSNSRLALSASSPTLSAAGILGGGCD